MNTNKIITQKKIIDIKFSSELPNSPKTFNIEKIIKAAKEAFEVINRNDELEKNGVLAK